MPTQWGWQVSRTAHLALERATTEGDGHGSGTMATVQTHYTAERERRRSKTHNRLKDLEDTQVVISAV